MAETQGTTGYGTKANIKTTKTAGEFLQLGEIKDISGPQITQQMADFTHMQSPAGYQEQKPTYKSSGQITFNVNDVPSDPGQIALADAVNANPTELCEFEIEYPNGVVASFKAYPSTSRTAPMAGAMEIAVTLNVTGPVDFRTD